MNEKKCMSTYARRADVLFGSRENPELRLGRACPRMPAGIRVRGVENPQGFGSRTVRFRGLDA